jgi:hypothetical protein
VLAGRKAVTLAGGGAPRPGTAAPERYEVEQFGFVLLGRRSGRSRRLSRGLCRYMYGIVIMSWDRIAFIGVAARFSSAHFRRSASDHVGQNPQQTLGIRGQGTAGCVRGHS